MVVSTQERLCARMSSIKRLACWKSECCISANFSAKWSERCSAWTLNNEGRRGLTDACNRRET